MKNEEDIKNKFKQALISTYKVISVDLYKTKNLEQNTKEKNYDLSEFDKYNLTNDFDKLRAKVDSDALNKKYTNNDILKKFIPNGNVERKLFEISEKIRCELIGSIKYKGVKKNLANVKIIEGEIGISPGQACVFYSKDENGDKLLGGGWISKTANKNLST